MNTAARALPAVVLLALGACVLRPGTPPAPDRAAIEQEVAATERAFAQTMAERDFAGFARFIAADAVFFSGAEVLRGKAAVLHGWHELYEGKAAPFSWQSAQVQALDSGVLALSTGPVLDAHGKRVAEFTSIWRRDAPHTWHIVFDKGNDVCDCKAPPPKP
jgi:ketosteroid isomerase-like protein